MANLQRLVKNTCNHNNEVARVFSSIARKSDSSIDHLSANTIVPNQVFASSYNQLGEFTKLIFSERAYKELENIREIDHLCASHRSSKGKKANPIKFVCYGYKDFDGDIVITNIDCPILERAYDKKFKNSTKFIDFISNETSSYEFTHEAPALMYDYLRTMDFKAPEIGTDVVALLGFTKPETSSDFSNSFKLSELAEAVIPNLPVKCDSIMTGAIAITPKTVRSSAIFYNNNKLNMRDYLQNGSLECALISYIKSKSTGVVYPTNIHDVKSAIGIDKDKEVNLLISSSKQPIEGLYTAKQQTLKDRERYM